MCSFARRLLSLAVGVFLLPHAALAYGPDGHHTVGAIADRLLVGTSTARHVAVILDGLSLENAAAWADCAKGVNEKTLKYVTNPAYPECAIYETPEGITAMEDYVTRNDQQCGPAPNDEVCHKGYHYTDIAIQHAKYDSSLIGARPTDVVAAIKAAIVVLQGGPSPAPFSFKDKREALLVLAHCLGDVHQPLHVGAVYLTPAGQRKNPDLGTYDPKTFTRGGNQLLVGGNVHAKLHAAWDGVPASLKSSHADQLAVVAASVPASPGTLFEWPEAWASETLVNAQHAFVGIKFGAKSGSTWPATLPPNYSSRMTSIKTGEIERAGRRLAEVLQTVLP